MQGQTAALGLGQKWDTVRHGPAPANAAALIEGIKSGAYGAAQLAPLFA
jgi:hypothetical protein